MTHTRKTTLISVGLVAACALTLVGVTAALWRTDLSTTAAIRDASVLFAVNGEVASAQNPSIDIELGPDEAQTLVNDGHLAIPVEVEALAQGNRGLSYSIDLPDIREDSIFYTSSLGLVQVESADECTVDTALGEYTDRTSTPVPAVYSDSETSTSEFWCFRADFTVHPDAGVYTSTGTIIGTHAFGEITYTKDWSIVVLSGVDPEHEPTQAVTFSYETISAGAGS